MSARNRELLALVPAALLLTGGFTAVFIQRDNVLSNGSLTYGAIFLGLCLSAHLLLRFTLPDADPYLFPLFAVLACFGLVIVYRIDETLARQQAQWFVIGLGLFAGTILLLREDYRVLERYRYTIAAAGIALLLLPRVPGIGRQVNGAYLGVGIGSMTFQPAEFAKIAIIIFLPAARRRRAALRGHHDPPAEVPRPAAGRLGRRDGDAVLHPGHRLLADVLRRLPGAPLRRHEPSLFRDDRLRPLRGGIVAAVPHPPHDPEPRGGVAAPVRHAPLRQAGRQLPARPVAFRAG